MTNLVYLEDLCEILDNKRIPITSSDRIKGPYPYYGANGIQDYINDYIFDDELVLLAEDGGNFGSKERPIAYRVSGKCWVNNHAHVLKPKECIDVDYLCYSLMYYDVTNLVNGATRQKLNQATMRKMQIPLIPIWEQKKIAQILNKLKKIISVRKEQIEKLDLLIKSQFVEVFGDIVQNSRKWQVQELDELCFVGSSKRVFVEELVESGIPFYRGTEIGLLSNGEIIVPKLFISNEHYESLKKYSGVPNIGDLLMPSICSDGRIWLVNTEEPFYFKDGRVLWIHVKSKNLNSLYLKHMLKEKFARDYNSIASGTTFEELKIFSLKSLKIMLPPIKLQNQFEKFVQQTDKQKFIKSIIER